MQEAQAAVVDEVQGLLEHHFRLGREARDQVGAQRDIRPETASLGTEGDSVGAQVTAPHPLQ